MRTILFLIQSVLKNWRQLKSSGFSVQTTIKEELLLQELCKHHPYTVDHMRRVEQYSTLIGKAMGLAGHSLAIVRHAGKMHDIGKLDVPQDLLNFRDDLTEAQMDKIKRHTLSSYIRLFGLRYPKALKEVPFVASAHHEHLDGSGYNGLKGNEIPLEARIVTVADVLDAMVSKRSYSEEIPLTETIAHLKQYSGIFFDADVVNALTRIAPSDFLKVMESEPGRPRAIKVRDRIEVGSLIGK
jgi:HD-GYP domain-containing protein (c-di-GMP phosphodiesterase class II)